VGRVAVVTLLILGVAGCATVRWERPGVTDAERARDETECTSLANRDYSVPVQRVMVRAGNRTSESIELETIRDFDSSAFDECMRTRGYEPLPHRPPGT
jgi:hypothetical protein